MSKKLRVFDWDDTLFNTAGKVMVTHADGSTEQFTPAQYAVYDPRSGDKFDYSQFVSVADPKIIRAVAKRFYKIVNAGDDGRLTVILTARGPDSVPHIQHVLQKYFRVNIPIISEDEMRVAKPDYLLVLPWCFISEFVKRETDFLNNGGAFIVPCPKFEIIGK